MSVADYGVKFGRQPDMGLEGQKAFPFIYTFVNRNDEPAAYDAAVNSGNAGAINLSSIGVLIPARGSGIEPASGSTKTVNILLDPDYNFKLLSIKFSVYYYDSQTSRYSWFDNANPTRMGTSFDNTAALPVSPNPGDTYTARVTANGWTIGNVYRWVNTATLPATSYSWVDITSVSTAAVFDNTVATPAAPKTGDTYTALVTANGWTANSTYQWNGTAWVDVSSVTLQSDGNDPDTPWVGTSYANYVRMSLYIQGSGSTTLFGGPSMNPAVKNTLAYDSPGDINGRAPVPLMLTQGYDYGFYAVRRPYLIPRQAVMSFDVTNDHPSYSLIVAAAIYGMKVRI